MIEVWSHIEKVAGTFESTEELMDYLKNNKLPHVDEHLELARNYRKLGKKTIPDYFKRIARKFPDLQAWDIMDAQLKLDEKEKGLTQEGAGEPNLENEVLKDDSLKEVNNKLLVNEFSKRSFDLIKILKQLVNVYNSGKDAGLLSISLSNLKELTKTKYSGNKNIKLKIIDKNNCLYNINFQPLSYLNKLRR